MNHTALTLVCFLIGLLIKEMSLNPAADKCVAFESSYHIDRTLVAVGLIISKFFKDLDDFNSCIAGCQCVVYESNGGSQGVFTSPNHPFVYPSHISCVLYTFIGDLDEIVQIEFIKFDFQRPARNGTCMDYLRLYLDLDRPEVHGPSTYELCGDISMVQHSYFSSRRSVIVEFRSDSLQTNNTGFHASYKFLEKAQYETLGGKKRSDAECIYDFYSTAENKHGRFFSPGYPQNYPTNSNCHYFFFGSANERVKITFARIDLRSRQDSCAVGGQDDVITVRDGVDVTSPIMTYYCGTASGLESVSTGENASIEFVSSKERSRQGFEGRFEFIKETILIKSLENPPRKHFDKNDQVLHIYDHLESNLSDNLKDSPVHNQDSKLDPNQLTNDIQLQGQKECFKEILSEQQMSGTVTSPNFPNPYPVNTRCTYSFRGRPNERVQLTLEAIDLRNGAQSNTHSAHECDEVDSITVTAFLDKDHPTELGVYCGSKKQLHPSLMSIDNRLDLFFQSGFSAASYSSSYPMDALPKYTGFLATYKFVTDFGISTGIQNTTEGCTFIYQSSDSRNGTFASPNYPGIYPRNTECHYLFHAGSAERVQIHFDYLDVDGIPPGCLEKTSSDYVELSNFNLPISDRKMNRLCGNHKENPSKYTSDTNFFRISFRSNQLFDATGFKGTYEFYPVQDRHVSRPKSLLSYSDPNNSDRIRRTIINRCLPVITLAYHYNILNYLVQLVNNDLVFAISKVQRHLNVR